MVASVFFHNRAFWPLADFAKHVSAPRSGTAAVHFGFASPQLVELSFQCAEYHCQFSCSPVPTVLGSVELPQIIYAQLVAVVVRAR